MATVNVRCPFANKPLEGVELLENMNIESLTTEAIAARIASFPCWHYEFDLQGCKTPIFKPSWKNRHYQRKGYFFDPLVRLCGRTLQGKRILDLGCNAGFWSLCAIEAGCDYVLGIDGRQMHVDQAEFVFQVKGIERERYDFRVGNVFDVLGEELGTFDIVLCLGLLYHICKHVQLFEGIAAVNSDILVIDSRLSPLPGSLLQLGRESTESPRAAIDYELVMNPTRDAVLDLASQFGYATAVLKPAFSDYSGCDDFQDGIRRAFLCAKKTNLAGLEVEENGSRPTVRKRTPDPSTLPARTLVAAMGRKILRRLVR